MTVKRGFDMRSWPLGMRRIFGVTWEKCDRILYVIQTGRVQVEPLLTRRLFYHLERGHGATGYNSPAGVNSFLRLALIGVSRTQEPAQSDSFQRGHKLLSESYWIRNNSGLLFMRDVSPRSTQPVTN